MLNLPPSAPATDQVEISVVLRVVLHVSAQRWVLYFVHNLVEQVTERVSGLVIAGGSFTSVMVMITMTVSLLVSASVIGVARRVRGPDGDGRPMMRAVSRSPARPWSLSGPSPNLCRRRQRCKPVQRVGQYVAVFVLGHNRVADGRTCWGVLGYLPLQQRLWSSAVSGSWSSANLGALLPLRSPCTA